jgi:sterol desaturase/sphingolipid hydroxylase (fatty acid hydroxylase superfamily)
MRRLVESRPRRWATNWAISVIDSAVVKLLFGAAAVGAALDAAARGTGLFNALDWPGWLEAVIVFLVLDFAIWLQHLVFHAIPALWRLHMVHHADLDFDVTTGTRFHPLEILLSMLIKFAVIILLGPPLLAVVLFEILLNAMAMFNHSNVRMPRALDAVLRLFVVTPDMHRVHHSLRDQEANSNFGFNLSFWDRLFGTYRSQPRDGHSGMTIGIDSFRDAAHCIRLPGMLLLPFSGRETGYAINRRRWTDTDDS